MAIGKDIKTFFDGRWQDGDVPIMRAADHGAWVGTTVFDGARYFDGVVPDLEAHCARVNRSAKALMLTPTMETGDMVEAVREGLKSYTPDTAVYIRPMYWGIDGDPSAIIPSAEATGFAISLEAIPLAPAETGATLTRTRFRRPVIEDAVVDAKAGCLYPNNARMLAEARAKGFSNALVADAMGNVAETATANIFMVKDGEVFTPIPNGTFLAGITRARHMQNMRDAGLTVRESVLSFEDFHGADEVFMSGNMNKVTPIVSFDDTTYAIGPVTRQAREMYWDWALGQRQ